MSETFSAADKLTLLNKPGIFSYRAYGSSGAYTKFLGVNGSKFNNTVEKAKISFDDVGVIWDEIADEKVDINISAGRVLDFDGLVALSGALFTKSTVAGVLVEDASQVIAASAWAFGQFILIANQNGDGSKIVVNSVTGGTDGLLVEDTDYFLTKVEGQGWGIYVIDSATVTTIAQTLTIVYDYTPAASTVLTRGGISTITPIEVRFDTLTTDGKAVYYWFYKVNASGVIGHGFGSENKAEPITMDIAFEVVKDTSRTAGDQLYRIVKAA